MAPGENSSARWGRVRRAAAAALAATFIVLMPVAVASAWIRGTVLSTSGYVAAISNIAASPGVRTVIREAVTAEASALLRGAGSPRFNLCAPRSQTSSAGRPARSWPARCSTGSG